MINRITDELYGSFSLLIDSPEALRSSISTTLVSEADSEGIVQREVFVDVVFLAVHFCINRNFVCPVVQAVLELIAEEFSLAQEDSETEHSAADLVNDARQRIMSKMKAVGDDQSISTWIEITKYFCDNILTQRRAFRLFFKQQPRYIDLSIPIVVDTPMSGFPPLSG